jgi:hypothetical protein
MGRHRTATPSASTVRKRKSRAREAQQRADEIAAGLPLHEDDAPIAEMARDAHSALEFLRSFMPATPTDAELAAEPDTAKRSAAIAQIMRSASVAIEVARARRKLLTSDEIKADSLKLAAQIRLAVDQIPALVDSLGLVGDELQVAKQIGRKLGAQILQAIAQRLSV